MYKIEKDVPKPKGSKTKYPFREMEVGDSVFIPDAPKASNGQFVTMTYIAKSQHKPNHAKFTQRTEGSGLRVWRVE